MAQAPPIPDFTIVASARRGAIPEWVASTVVPGGAWDQTNTRSFKHDQIAIDPDGKILQSRWKKAVGKF